MRVSDCRHRLQGESVVHWELMETNAETRTQITIWLLCIAGANRKHLQQVLYNQAHTHTPSSVDVEIPSENFSRWPHLFPEHRTRDQNDTLLGAYISTP